MRQYLERAITEIIKVLAGKKRLIAGECYSSKGEDPLNPVEALQLGVRGEGFLAVSGIEEYHKDTPHNKPHTRDLLRKTQKDGCLFLDKKQQETEQETDLCKVSQGEVFQGGGF